MNTTRRNLVQGAALSAGLGVLGALPDGARAQDTAGPAGTPTIEPLTMKRRGTGFRGLDPARAFTVKVFRGEDGKPVSSVSSVQERVALLQSIVVVNSAIGQEQEVGRDIFSIDKAPFNHHRYQRPFDLFR